MVNNIPVLVCLLSALVVPATLAAYSLGFCPSKTGVQINPNDMVGTWYVQAKNPNVLELNVACSKITVAALGNGVAYPLSIGTLRSLLGTYSVANGTASVLRNGTFTDRIDVTLPFLFGQSAKRYTVLAVGAPTGNPSRPSFVVLWSCYLVPLGNMQNIWVLAPENSPAPQAEITSAVKSIGFNPAYLQNLSTNCTG